MTRFTFGSLIRFIAVLALGLAAMRSGTPFANRAVFQAVLAALFVGLLGALVGRGRAWIGFALFGWGLAIISFLPALREPIASRLFIDDLAQWVADRVYQLPAAPGLESIEGPIPPTAEGQAEWQRKAAIYNRLVQARSDQYFPIRQRYDASIEIFRSMMVLLFALIGAVLGRLLSARRPAGGLASFEAAS